MEYLCLWFVAISVYKHLIIKLIKAHGSVKEQQEDSRTLLFSCSAEMEEVDAQVISYAKHPA